MLRIGLASAAARGAIVAISAALLHGGSRTCSPLGWVAGLAILPMDQPARVFVAARLTYAALHSALLATAAPATTVRLIAEADADGGSRALVPAVGHGVLERMGRLCGGSGAFSDSLLERPSWHAPGAASVAAPAAGALLLAASSAFLLGEYARAAVGRPSMLHSQGVHTMHFMLGFDGLCDVESREGQQETEAETL
jgi:hypothetical protein